MSESTQPEFGAGDGADKHMFPCSACGAKLVFKPGADRLQCEYCGNVQEIASEGGGTAEIKEYDFASALTEMRRRPAKELMPSGSTVRCDSCGAESVISGQSDHCAFCGSPVVVAVEITDEIFVPESLLPFKLEKREAKDKFERWVGKLWFAPNDIKKRAKAQGMDGIYLPYWTYDSQTTTNYLGQRGEYYYETEYYTDSEGKRQSRQVRRTRWYPPRPGVVHVEFDDVLICASESLPRKIIRGLEPWDLADLRPYEPGYLSGFVAERYKVDLEAGFRLAEERMEPEIRSTIESDIGGDTQRILLMNIRHDAVTFKHLLLPVWISSFRYNDKAYRFMVNARTGEVSGERPYSWIKITLAVLLVVAIIAVIVYFAKFR
ncbi:MAG: hypothetical protein KC636_21590 [Myxococcales bacterium]|nr:hypothetical protein [Myxococcales bacterium]